MVRYEHEGRTGLGASKLRGSVGRFVRMSGGKGAEERTERASGEE